MSVPNINRSGNSRNKASYLTKPFNVDQLKKSIVHIISQQS